MSSSYGAPSTSKSAKLRPSPSTSRRSHDKAIAKSDKLRHSPSTTRRRPKKCIDKAKLQNLKDAMDKLAKSIHHASSSSRSHKKDATVHHNMPPSSSGSSKERSPRQQARRRQHEEKHPNDFRRHPSAQERQRRHDKKMATKAHPMVSPSATTSSAPLRVPRFTFIELPKFDSPVDEIVAYMDDVLEKSLRRRRKKHGHKREDTTKTAPFASTSHDMLSPPSAITTLVPIWQDEDLIYDNCQGQDHDPRECPNLLCPRCNRRGHMM